MTRQDVLRRLCALQNEVWEAMCDPGAEAADCFCGEGGFWDMPRYANNPSEYRNGGTALAFIETAVREKLATVRVLLDDTGREK